MSSFYKKTDKLEKMERIILFFLLAAKPLFANQSFLPSSKQWLLAQNSAFDPFIDYGEFQDNVTEEENINFFQNGRSLALSVMGGWEALTMNIRQIYGDAPFFGANISFFLDLRLALQIRGVFPTSHYNSLFGSTFPFSHYGMDLKYYFDRQYINKDADFLNPYVVFGPFWLNIKHNIPKTATASPAPASPPPSAQQAPANIPLSNPSSNPSTQEIKALDSFNSAGLKIGAGIEFPLVKKSFAGIEISYLYTVLEHENEDLSLLELPASSSPSPNQPLFDRLLFPNRPQVVGYRFFGDLANFSVFIGINF